MSEVTDCSLNQNWHFRDVPTDWLEFTLSTGRQTYNIRRIQRQLSTELPKLLLTEPRNEPIAYSQIHGEKSAKFGMFPETRYPEQCADEQMQQETARTDEYRIKPVQTVDTVLLWQRLKKRLITVRNRATNITHRYQQ